MKRKYKHIATIGSRSLCVDVENEAEIMAYFKRDKRHLKKYNFISELILRNVHTKKQYDKVDINENCKNVTEMRFFVGQENDRVYCKELTGNGTVIIIASILHELKKSTELSSKEISLINTVGSYEYEAQ